MKNNNKKKTDVQEYMEKIDELCGTLDEANCPPKATLECRDTELQAGRNTC